MLDGFCDTTGIHKISQARTQMAIRRILKMGEPLLWERAEPVTEFGTRFLDELIQDMLDTMVSSDGVGLAAPQIGISLRVVIFAVDHNPRYPDMEVVPQTILINPEITPLTDETDGYWEGCLSVPGLRGYVERPNQIHYRGFDKNGHVIDREASGFHATVVQHECDHLDGVLYPMRIKDLRNFAYEDVLRRG
jgi:peptide deformylase